MLKTILIITEFQALFFLVIIATKKQKSSFEKCIMGWTIGLFLHIFFSFLTMNTDGELKKCFHYISLCFLMVHGPFLYICANSLIYPSQKISLKLLLHFIPFFLMVFLGFLNNFNSIEIINILVYFIYISLTIRKLRNFKHYAANHFSNIEKLNLNWLYLLLYGQVFFLVTGVFSFILVRFYHIHFNMESSEQYLYTFSNFLFINLLGFTVIKRTFILTHPHTLDVVRKNEESIMKQEENNKTTTQKEEKQEVPKKEIYSNYGLKEDDALVFSNKLKKYMEENQPYKNSELTLKDLAKAVETYPHYITQVLNSTLHQNFYDFINTYRVEEAKKLLTNQENNMFTILAIAYDCGFSSKSSFNRIFKQKTGYTPSEFKQKYLINKLS